MDVIAVDRFVRVGTHSLQSEQISCKKLKSHCADLKSAVSASNLVLKQIQQAARKVCSKYDGKMVQNIINNNHDFIKQKLLKLVYTDIEQFMYHVDTNSFKKISWSSKIVEQKRKIIDSQLNKFLYHITKASKNDVPKDNDSSMLISGLQQLVAQYSTNICSDIIYDEEDGDNLIETEIPHVVSQMDITSDNDNSDVTSSNSINTSHSSTDSLSACQSSPCTTPPVTNNSGKAHHNLNSLIIDKVKLMYKLLNTLKLNDIVAPAINTDGAATILGGAHFMTKGNFYCCVLFFTFCFLFSDSLLHLIEATELNSSSVLLELGCGLPFVAMSVCFAMHCKVLAVDMQSGLLVWSCCQIALLLTV